MKDERLPVKIWYILYPFLFYYAVMLSIMTLLQMAAGTGKEHYVQCQMAASFVTIFFMLPFYRQDAALSGKTKEKLCVTKEKLFHVLAAVLITICIGTALNNIISMTPLVEISKGYQEANEGFYGSTLAFELVSSAVFTPVLEELVFRGILFTRLKSMMPRVMAVILSSFIFAVIHFNIVQFIYALMIGILLAVLMECAGNLYAAAAGHMAVNALAVLRTETGLLGQTVAGDVFSWSVSLILLVIGMILLYIYIYYLKNTRKIV